MRLNCVLPYTGLSSLFLPTTLGSRFCFYPHFTDVETEISQLVSGRAAILNQVCLTHSPRSLHAPSPSPACRYDAVNLEGVPF